MTINLEITDRQFKDIELYCSVNNLQINDYLIDIITEKHSINKFGDLNEIIPKVIESKTVESKKRGRPKKKTEENVTEIKEEENDIESKKYTGNTENIEKEEIKPIAKRKRKLNTL